MAFKKKLGTDVTTKYPSGLATWPKITSWIKQIIRANAFEFYELEAFEVERVDLQDEITRGVIGGRFVRPDGESLDNVKPLWPNITTVPLIGEHVVVGEYNGQFYYSRIINRRSSVNENTFSTSSTKMGKRFERRNVKKISINEGSIVYEGRYGNSLHFDRGRDFSPQILLRVNKDFNDDENFVRENIDNDDSSIYLISDGLSTINFDGDTVEGKKVLIKSNGIFISGRDEVKINAPNLKVTKNETKLGSKDAKQPLVLGDDLKRYLEGLEQLIELLATAVGTITTSTPGATALTGYTSGKLAVKQTMKSGQLLSNKVKTI